MSAYDELLHYARSMTYIINRKYKAGNNMAYLALLSGVAGTTVEAFPGAGHNYQAVIDAIHSIYRDDPESGVDSGYVEGLEGMIRVATGFPGLNKLVDVLLYEGKLEKEGKATFRVDLEGFWAKTATVIRENTDSYRSEYPGFDKWLEDTKTFAKENYGLNLE